MRRTPYLLPLFLIFMGSGALFNVSSRAAFQAYRAVDVVGLLASGACFGAALVMFVFFMRGGRID
jgi:hypothetical protein